MTTKTTAAKTATDASGCRIILIAGLCLQHNQVTDEFRRRLDRAIALGQEKEDEYKNNDRIIILGGITGANQISEARAGADYLVQQGVAGEKIMLEDQSRHTLENMQHARSLLLNTMSSRAMSSRAMSAKTGLNEAQTQKLPENLFIISSRYHLLRVLTLAKGLKMSLQPIAAEQTFSFSWQTLFRVLKEAYYLHWYWSGKLWVYMTVNHKSQARIR